MFDFVKRLFSLSDYQQRFRKLATEMWERHHLDDDTYDNLLYSMASIEHELNHIGGGNWNSGDYGECLETVTDILCSAEEFTARQIAEIRRCAEEIAACGRELLETGSSGADLTHEIDYLVARTVDWCHAHPKANADNA